MIWLKLNVTRTGEEDGFGCLSETTCILEFWLLILLITNRCKTV
jgi:hypothetical protein